MADLATLLTTLRETRLFYIDGTAQYRAADAIDALVAENRKLRDALESCRQTHYECEDCWYSCPMSADGCCDEREQTECTCGAEHTNAIIDAALATSSSASS